MVKIKLDRQQLEAMTTYFFPYMEMLCETKVNDAQKIAVDEFQYLKELIIQCHFEDLVCMINNLKGSVKKEHTLELEHGEAIAFYLLLRQLPINKEFQWLNEFKDFLLTIIQNQVWE